MRTAGIREVKDRLSEFVRLAREGEQVLITDRGEVVAMLGPPGPAFEETKYPLLELMIRQGRATRARAQPPRSLRSHQRSGNLSGGLRAVARRGARRPLLNLYADASAVLAWLLREARADETGSLLAGANLVLSSQLTLVECDRALLRLHAEGRFQDGMRAELSARVSAAATAWTPDRHHRVGSRSSAAPLRRCHGAHARRHPSRERARRSSPAGGARGPFARRSDAQGGACPGVRGRALNAKARGRPSPATLRPTWARARRRTSR